MLSAKTLYSFRPVILFLVIDIVHKNGINNFIIYIQPINLHNVSD